MGRELIRLCVAAQDEFGAFLNNVAVHKRFRGRGVGTCLVAAALEVAAGQLQARRLYTQVDCDNPPALALYDRHGFVRVEGSQDTCKLPSKPELQRLLSERVAEVEWTNLRDTYLIKI